MKKMLKNGEIYGEYFVRTKSLAFDQQANINEIDELIDLYKQWEKLLRYMKRNNMSLTSVKYIIASHYPFDHNGGLWKLFDEIKIHSPNVKIISSFETIKLVNILENTSNLRSRKSFGPLMGELRMIEESAFKVLKSENYFDINESCPSIIDKFELKDSDVELGVIKSPGHSPDHICPFFIRDGVVDFVYVGESVGIFIHETKLVTLPSSSAPDFNYKVYMDSN